jgi:drug/metabolite transporter (DMT)-like permease
MTLPLEAQRILDLNTQKYNESASKYTAIFMITLFVIGVILTVISWDIDSKLEDKKCTSKELKTANKIVLCIGIIFIVSSLSFYACSTKCNSSITGFHYNFYIFAMLALGITLIVLGSIISSESSKTPECNNTGNPTIIWGLGTLIVLACGLYFYNEYKPMIH